MRRITTWLIATLAVVAIITYYQVSLSGDGKAGERTDSAAPAAANCDGPRSSAAESPESDGDKANDPCASSDHTGKPGESN
jgi:hypothetical protein